MLKLLYWIVGLVVIVVAIPLVLTYAASELGGEVVTLHRHNEDGSINQVRVWIVDDDQATWIEHGDAESFWVSRLQASPDIKLVRDGREQTYQAKPDPEAHAHYHELRNEKYGWAADVVAVFAGGGADCSDVPVRLQL